MVYVLYYLSTKGVDVWSQTSFSHFNSVGTGSQSEKIAPGLMVDDPGISGFIPLPLKNSHSGSACLLLKP